MHSFKHTDGCLGVIEHCLVVDVVYIVNITYKRRHDVASSFYMTTLRITVSVLYWI